jgi:hypothetical protein
MKDDETIRQFFSRRTWMHGEGRLISDEEYAALMRRELVLPEKRVEYLLAFIDGWKAAKQ